MPMPRVIRYSEAEVLAAKAEKEGSFLQQLRSTHFLACNHIPHTTNFAALVDLIVTCGKISSNLLKHVPEMPPTPLQTPFGLWVEEFQLKRLCKAPFYSVMANECTDIATIEELSLFFVGLKMVNLLNIL